MKLSVGRADRNIFDFIREYLQPRGLLREDFFQIQGQKKLEYWSEEHFWQDVIHSGQIYETCHISLRDFLLTTWIPRSPGQYYTAEARYSRKTARSFVEYRNSNQLVFDPYGKSEMIKGGVGCLRLAQKHVGNESIHFLCATSSGIAHKGLLVGLPRNLYERLVEDMERYGGIVCSISGQIRYWSYEDMLPTYTPKHIPRMYLHVERLNNLQRVVPGTFDVTAAVLFRGTVDRREGTFFVYSHFDPGQRHSIDRTIDQCVDWMERSYVKGLYDGEILTDFDEVTPRFDDVSFPVKALMNPQMSASSIVRMCSKLYSERSSADKDSVATLVRQVLEEKAITTMNITITGDGNVIGNQNRVITKINEGLSSQDIRALGETFALFRAEVLQLDSIPEKLRNRAVRAIEDAEEEAADKNPDPQTIEDGLKRAKNILESADQVYDKSISWGQRLATLAQILIKTIPGGWSWLSSLI